MTFIDSNAHKYGAQNFEEIEHIGVRHCNAEDLKGYEDLIGDTFDVYPKSMLCVNDLNKLRILQ